MLAGDFNCANIDWNTATKSPGAPDHQIQQDLIDLTAAAQVTQIHDEPTRGDNTLDLVLTTNPSLLKSTASVPGISDHEAVVTDFDTQPQRARSKPGRRYPYSRANLENLNAEIGNITERIMKMDEEGNNIDIMWNEFKTLLLSAIEGNIPSHTQRRNNRYPWINKEVKRPLRKKKRLYKQAKKTGKWENYRFLQKECRRQMRAIEWEYINNAIEEGLRNNNTKPFWSYIKSRRQDSTGVAPLKKGTTLQSDGANKAHILLDQFKSAFTPNDGTPLPKMKGAPFPTLEQLTIDTNGVAKLLKNVNPAKACGTDGIPNMILKTCADAIAPALTCIYRRSIQTGQFPADWQSAKHHSSLQEGRKKQSSKLQASFPDFSSLQTP